MYYNLQAFILRRQAFKDDDLLITLYSLEKGKLTLQAKGAKKILSKLAGHLEPLTLSKLNVTLGKNIDQLIGAQSLKSYAKLKNNLSTLGYASYFIELITSLTPENHPDPHLFSLVQKSFDYLESNNNFILARISFGFKLLYLLGFNPADNPDLKLVSHIKYIIQNTINDISLNQQLISYLPDLNKILDHQLELHLEKEIKSKQFLIHLYV